MAVEGSESGFSGAATGSKKALDADPLSLLKQMRSGEAFKQPCIRDSLLAGMAGAGIGMVLTTIITGNPRRAIWALFFAGTPSSLGFYLHCIGKHIQNIRLAEELAADPDIRKFMKSDDDVFGDALRKYEDDAPKTYPV